MDYRLYENDKATGDGIYDGTSVYVEQLLRIANLKMMVKLKSLTVVCTPNRLPLAPSNQCDYTNQKPLSSYRPEAL